MTKATILVVDDSASLRSVVRLMLERAGYRVAEAIDGRDALRKVADLHPALVLCDVNMPGLDGLGLVRQIKSNPEHRAIAGADAHHVHRQGPEGRSRGGRRAGLDHQAGAA